jgi:hypothetical protein
MADRYDHVRDAPEAATPARAGLADMSASPTEAAFYRDLTKCSHEKYRLPLLGTEDSVAINTWVDDLGRLVQFAMGSVGSPPRPPCRR